MHNKFMSEVTLGELEKIDFESELDGSNDLYYIKPTIASIMDGEREVVYGVFKRDTHVMEAATKQTAAAVEWASALKKMVDGGIAPMIMPMSEEEPRLN